MSLLHSSRKLRFIDFSLGPYKNFIFDCFGVLVAWDRAVKVPVSATSGQERTAFHLQTFLQHPSMLAAEKGLLTHDSAFLQISQEYEVPYEKIIAMTEMTRSSLYAVQDCINLIDELCLLDRKSYCLTNLTEETFSFLKSQYTFWDKFEDIFVSAELGLRKPDPKIFQYVLEQKNLLANETVFIDDEPENIETARTLGIAAIEFKGIEQLIQELRLICLDNG